jgi:hypothetical protein
MLDADGRVVMPDWWSATAILPGPVTVPTSSSCESSGATYQQVQDAGRIANADPRDPQRQRRGASCSLASAWTAS